MIVAYVDTSALLDVLQADPHWAGWSRDRMAEHMLRGDVAVGPIVYAEAATGFRTIEGLDGALARLGVALTREMPRAALFLAAKAHAAYRRRGGRQPTLLPDFLIGAHAAIAGLPLITRDPRRVRAAFPGLRLVAPPAH